MQKIKKLIKKLLTKEMILYLVFGVLTTAINLVTFSLCYRFLPVATPQWLTVCASCIAWLVAVVFAFVTNKLFVFESKSTDKRVMTHEILTFFGARVFSQLVDMGGMLLLVNLLMWNADLSKLLMNVLVVIINYVLSKLVIFTKKESAQPPHEQH
ncbi:MAG TPA: GtrA family protein [Candidatus Gallacutalibacter stercoravium]|nr:GtrA family protein [Candidatus Gallacutalibacter stercoravium]